MAVEARKADERLLTGYSGRIFLLLTLGFFALKIVQRLLPPLLPVIIDDLAITPFLAGIALSLMRIWRTVSQYPGGRLSDQLSRKTMLVPSIGVLIVGLAVLNRTVVYSMFLIGVTIVGVGFGLFEIPDKALVSDLFERRRGQALGIHMMASDIAGVLAAGLSVTIVAIATWRAAFLPSIVMLVVVMVLLYLWSREPIDVSRVDLAIRETGVRLLIEPHHRWLLIGYALFNFSVVGITSFLPTFLSAAHGFSFALASGAFAGLYAVGGPAKLASGALSDRIPRPVVGAGGLVIASIGLVILVVAPSAAVVLVGVVVYAAGTRSFPPAMQAYLMDIFPDSSVGGDFGATRAVYMSFGSLGPTYVGFVAERASYLVAFTSIIGLFVVAAVITFWKVYGRAKRTTD